jgi:hypothetical protein
MKNGKIANINVTIKKLFFRWLALTKPFHNLSKQQQTVLGLLLYYNHMYKKDISKDELRWKMVFNYDTKMLIKEELDINDARMQNILTSLRKSGAIINNQIVSTFIPDLELDSNIFRLVFNFKIIDDKKEG